MDSSFKCFTRKNYRRPPTVLIYYYIFINTYDYYNSMIVTIINIVINCKIFLFKIHMQRVSIIKDGQNNRTVWQNKFFFYCVLMRPE